MPFGAVTLLLLGLVVAAAWWTARDAGEGGGRAASTSPGPSRSPSPTAHPSASTSPSPGPSPEPSPLPINTAFEGITTFRGNATRTYYGEGPVPRRAPEILWRYPPSGGLCRSSTAGGETEVWCGVGWTGQPHVIVGEGGRIEIRINAYDGGYHFLDAETGEPVRPSFMTGDLAKGSATSDPDGYPLYYAGSRDNRLRVIALDRPEPTVLWELDSLSSVPNPVWNSDWDGAPLVIGDLLIEGGENSWFYVIRLNRGYDRHGLVTVDPEVVFTAPGYDDALMAALPDTDVSIEGSVAERDGVVYFANSGGLVQGWDVSRILAGRGDRARRVFRFWTGDDTDATVVIDEEGYLYVASELQRFNGRSAEVGQVMKLDPRRPRDPLVWGFPVTERGADGLGGVWATPALYGDMLYVATNAGDLIGIDRETGQEAWRIHLVGPTWSSPVPVDGVLLQGDCSGTLHAFDLSGDLHREPRELWAVRVGGCIEATPSVWRGRIYVGSRDGGLYALGRA
ncbi:MAG: hypothetical protein KatS3mg014_0075 [Actinomycetota bacterium]|nr:MAG: hypothetical protein KatS3mg014_0075 [Actinomycetota bacterium]